MFSESAIRSKYDLDFDFNDCWRELSETPQEDIPKNLWSHLVTQRTLILALVPAHDKLK
jgi:hypothetical protein